MVSIGPYTITMREAQGEYDGPFSTYPEAHSFLWAVGYMTTLVMALQVSEAAATLVMAQIVRVSYFAMTGKRIDISGHNLGLLPDAYLRQIRKESHYWFGGLLLGFGVAYGLDYMGYSELLDPLERFLPDEAVVAAVPSVGRRMVPAG